MKERQRLYPTVKEDRELERLKRQFGLAENAIAKSGGRSSSTTDKEAKGDAAPDTE